MDRKRVVVTGMGLITPLGQGVQENWRRFKTQDTGIRPYPISGSPNEACRYLGKVSSFDLPSIVSRKVMNQVKYLNRSGTFGFVAAHEALDPITSRMSHVSPEVRALYVATGDYTNAGCEFMFPALKIGLDESSGTFDRERLNKACMEKVNPFFLLESLHNNPFSFLSSVFELKGANACLTSTSPCGLNALELAFRSIRNGETDMALVVGCGNWITDIVSYEMNRLNMLSSCDSGAESFRPFDAGRDGFIPGEGAAALVLESSRVAEKRDVEILAAIDGVAGCVQVSHCGSLDVPDKISERAIRMALEEGDGSPKKLAFVLAHGDGSVEGDRSELSSMGAAFGKEITGIPIAGLKPYTGHLGAASDLAEVIFGIKAIKEGFVPGTLHFEEPEPAFADFQISSTHVPCEKNAFVSVSYGMGGQCVSAFFEV